MRLAKQVGRARFSASFIEICIEAAFDSLPSRPQLAEFTREKWWAV